MLEMYEYLNSQYNLEYILTYRLNKDVLNFFSYIRAMDGTNDHPCAIDCKYRLRRFVLDKYSKLWNFTYNKLINHTALTQNVTSTDLKVCTKGQYV